MPVNRVLQPLARRSATLAAALILYAVSSTAWAQCTKFTVKPVAETWKASSFKSNNAQIIIYTAPTDHGGEFQLASGIDKSLWVTLFDDNAIMKFSINGKAEIYVIPTPPGAEPMSITTTPTKMWFAEYNAPCIGSITAGGKITEYTGTDGEYSFIESLGMATGASQTPWFLPRGGIGRVGPNGKVKLYPLCDCDQLNIAGGITYGPDGNMWFENYTGGHIGKVTPKGKVILYGLEQGTNGTLSYGIAAGSDGRIWFTDATWGRIGVQDTDGKGLTYYSTGLTVAPVSMVAGPDGNLYFGGLGAVGRITTAGVITSFPFPKAEASFLVASLAVGPDGNIWFTNMSQSQIGKLKLPID